MSKSKNSRKDYDDEEYMNSRDYVKDKNERRKMKKLKNALRSKNLQYLNDVELN